MNGIIQQLFNPPRIDKNTDDYTEIFKLPIEYNGKKRAIDENIINDLCLLNKRLKIEDSESESHADASKIVVDDINKYEMSLYTNVFKPAELFSITNMNMWSKYYTTDHDFLKDTQQLIKIYKSRDRHIDIIREKEVLGEREREVGEERLVRDNEIYEICEDIIHDEYFIDRFHYIDLPFFRDLNKNDTVLQFAALHNLSSPLLALLVPLVSILLPFFIIKLQGHNITMELYVKHIKSLLGNHALAQLFVNLNETAIEKKIYILVSLLFYGFQIYNNINTCKSYYNNIEYIHDTLKTTRQYLLIIVEKMDGFLEYSGGLSTYREFNRVVEQHRTVIIDYLGDLAKIQEYKMSIKKVLELGHLMKCFYVLNSENSIVEAIKYSFGFTGYLDNLALLQREIHDGRINFCEYITNETILNSIMDSGEDDAGEEEEKHDKKRNRDREKRAKEKRAKERKREKDKERLNCSTRYTDIYFAGISEPVKNSVKLANNMIITGPNAAGKTTLLKSILFNTILNQQIGCGFYDKAHTRIYDYIHCYINIPDTGGRDSLFQAESRRCKEILTTIHEDPTKNHFCVFDELYSGTNPYEAIASGCGYLKYLEKYKNVNFVLTTHYTELCKKIESSKTSNYYMDIREDDAANGEYQYTYKIKSGISSIKGGSKVLRDLEYPTKIIDDMSKVLNGLKM